MKTLIKQPEISFGGTNDKGIHLVGWKKISRPKSLGCLGIRSARKANTCLLGKLVWDVIQYSGKLCVNLLSNRCVADHNILQATDSPNGSPTWSSIIKAKYVLKAGYSWRVGSGSSSFGFSQWTTLGILGSLVPYIDIHGIQLTVKEVLSANDPHTHILYSQLSQTTSDHINHIHTNFNDTVEDTYIWNNQKNGTYSPLKMVI